MTHHSFGSGSAHPKWKGGKYLSMGYVQVLQPNHPRASKGYVQEHILIVEAALGHFLARKSPVHHVNEVKSDNSHGNLVACEDRAYHSLLHARTRALDACGDPNARCCVFCGDWDSIDNLIVRNRGYRHKTCEASYAREQAKRRMQS